MARLIRDEDELLELLLSIPATQAHPKVKRYMDDYQKALLEELTFEQEVIRYLNHQSLIAVRTEAHFLAELEKREDDATYHLHQMAMMKQQTPTVTLAEQQLVLQKEIDAKEAEQVRLVSAIAEEKKKLVEASAEWSERQEKMHQSLMQKIKDEGIKVYRIGKSGEKEEIPQDELMAKMAAMRAQNLEKVLGHAKHLPQAMMQNGKLDDVAVQQVVKQFSVQNEIKLLAMMLENALKEENDIDITSNLKPAKFAYIRRESPDFTRAYADENSKYFEKNVECMGRAVTSACGMKKNEDQLMKLKKEVEEKNEVLGRITAVVGERPAPKPIHRTPSHKKQ
jgi:hypothetical protein